MKSLVVNDQGILSIENVSMPRFNEYQALVKMESCGICNGTDMKLIHRQFKGFHTYPAILGHEGVGRVVETGSKVKHLKIGDIVLLPFLEEKTDGYYPAWGAFSEYAVVGDGRAMLEDGVGPHSPLFSEAYYAQQVVPEDISPVNAAMIVTFREVLSACKRFGFRENNSLVIFGAGPVGLCFTKFAKLLGMGPIMLVGIHDEKIREGAALGADYIWNSTKVDIIEEIRKVCKDGVDFVVDAAGVNQIINQAMELVRYNGKICCYGISPQLNMQLDWSKAPYNWDLQFLQWPSKLEESQCHRQIVSWIQTGVLNPEDFISDVIEFDRVIDAYKMVEEKKAKKKIIIAF